MHIMDGKTPCKTPSAPWNDLRKLKITLLCLLLLHKPQIVEAVTKKDNIDGPRFVDQELNNFTVRVGNDVTFSCTVDNLGNYKVAWLHSEKGSLAVYPQVITQNTRISVSHDNRATYFLQLKDVQESDAGKYICQLNTGPVVSISGALSVVVPPDILDEESSSDTLASEGMRVALTCKARGNPTPTISWRREDGKPIRICEVDRGGAGKKDRCREVQKYFGSELVLAQISRFDSGVFLCLASNRVPPTVSKRVRLYVDFPPTLWITHQLVGAESGGSAQLDCLTAAHPPSLNYWSKVGSHITEEAGKYHMEQIAGEPSHYNIQMKLRIFNITQHDFGTYRCVAKNPQGDTSGEINLYEVPKSTTTTPAYNFRDYDWNPPEEIPVANETTVILLNEGRRHKEKERRNKHKKKNREEMNRSQNNEIKNFDRTVFGGTIQLKPWTWIIFAVSLWCSF